MRKSDPFVSSPGPQKKKQKKTKSLQPIFAQLRLSYLACELFGSGVCFNGTSYLVGDVVGDGN